METVLRQVEELPFDEVPVALNRRGDKYQVMRTQVEVAKKGNIKCDKRQFETFKSVSWRSGNRYPIRRRSDRLGH